MGKDLESLSFELILAQLLLTGVHERLGKLMEQISCRKILDDSGQTMTSGTANLINPASKPDSVEQRDAEIRRMLERLEKLG